MADGAESVRILCELAADEGASSTCIATRPTIRCRATSRRSRTETQRLGLQGRVTGSHLTSMHSMDNYYVSKLIPLIREARRQRDRQSADQHHDPGPARHVSEAPRHDARAGADGGRRQRRVRSRLRDGPVVRARQRRHARSRVDGPARRADDERRPACARASTPSPSTPAQILHLDGYGIAPGYRADFVLLQARDPVEAIRLRAARLAVIRAGQIVAESPPATATLRIDGRPAQVDWNLRAMRPS